MTVDAPELWGAVDPEGDFVPAHVTGTAAVPEGAPPPLLAVTLNGVVAAITRPYSFRAYGRDGVWEAIVDPALLRPGANALGVFAVHERGDGTVALAEAYAGDGEPRAVNLILDTAAALLGATATGLHGLEHAAGRAFRWTTGEATITVPAVAQAAPAELAVDVLMTGRPKRLRVEVDGCVLFDDNISNRWSEAFSLDDCRLTPPDLEIRLVSAHPRPGDRRQPDARHRRRGRRAALTPSPHFSPAFVARASRRRCGGSHGLNDAAGVVVTTSKRREGVRPATASGSAAAAEGW